MDIKAIGNGLIQIGGVQIEKEGVTYFPFLKNQYVYVQPKGWGENIRLKVSETTLDGAEASDAQSIMNFIDNAFSQGGGGGESPVQSVNGKTGSVVLNAEDIKALPDTYKPSYNDLSDKPAVIAAGETQAAARSAIQAAMDQLATAGRNGLYPYQHFGAVYAMMSVSQSGNADLDGGFNSGFIRSFSVDTTVNVTGIKTAMVYRVKIINTASIPIEISFEADGAAVEFSDGDGTIPANSGAYFELYKFNLANTTVRKLQSNYIVLTSPNGTKYLVTVNDEGSLQTTAI